MFLDTLKNQPENKSVEAIRTIFRKISEESGETGRFINFIKSKGLWPL